jgi:hypothetical protein
VVSTEDGSLQWVARAVCLETVKHGSVRGPGCNSPGLLGNSPDLLGNHLVRARAHDL